MKNITKLTIELITVGLISCTSTKVVLANPQRPNPITYGTTNISQVSTPEDNTLPDFEVEVERSLLAQRSGSTLEQAWPYSGIVIYQWLRSSDGKELHSSGIYIELTGNKLSLYNSHQLEPLGQNARCGGFGCNRAKGSLVATLIFEPQGNLFVVREASERANFLQGAKCKLKPNVQGDILECSSTTAPPRSTNLPSIYRFVIPS